jgi:hypothetical protein
MEAWVMALFRVSRDLVEEGVLVRVPGPDDRDAYEQAAIRGAQKLGLCGSEMMVRPNSFFEYWNTPWLVMVERDGRHEVIGHVWVMPTTAARRRR